VAGFTVASGLCAAAHSPATLLGSRVLQGAMGWPSWVFAAMAAAAPVLAVFVLWERRKARADGAPLISAGSPRCSGHTSCPTAR
jgi:hypothetical protein